MADPAVEVTFKEMLLVRCQEELEKLVVGDEEMVTRKASLEEASCDEKTKLQANFHEFKTAARHRNLGNLG